MVNRSFQLFCLLIGVSAIGCGVLTGTKPPQEAPVAAAGKRSPAPLRPPDMLTQMAPGLLREVDIIRVETAAIRAAAGKASPLYARADRAYRAAESVRSALIAADQLDGIPGPGD
jgi:hypothetical protein